MALSNMTIVSDGNLEFVSISFNYLDRSEINVYFDAVPTSTWAWVGDTNQIKFTPNVPNGVTVLIARVTDASDLRHTFSEGAAFTAKTLDEDLRQVLHIVQEAKETNLSGNFYADIDMNNNKVTNLAPGSNPSDAVTFQQLQDLSPDAGLRAELAKDYANTGSGIVGFRQDAIGAVGRSVESKLRETVSVEDFGAIGDGVTDDSTAFDAAKVSAGDYGYYVTHGNYNIGISDPDYNLNGGGKVIASGVTTGGTQLTYNPARESVFFSPDTYQRESQGINYPPPRGSDHITSSYNIVVAPGSKLNDLSKTVRYNTAFGYGIGSTPGTWGYNTVFGNDAMMYAYNVNRNTVIGSEAMAWAGAPNQAWLITYQHDWWRKPPDNPYTPGEPGWDAVGLETLFPGIGSRIASYSDYPTNEMGTAYNTAIGRDAGNHIVKGVRNVFVGYQAASQNFVGSYNVAVGALAMSSAVFADYITAIGDQAGRNCLDSTNAVFVGYGAGRTLKNASHSVIIGDRACDTKTSAVGAVLIGREVGRDEVGSLDTKLIINNNAGVPLIAGDFAADRAGVNLRTHQLRALWHVRNANSGSTLTPSVGMLVEGAALASVTVETSDTGIGALRFADTSATTAGSVEYSHSSDSMTFVVAASGRLRIENSGNVRPWVDNTQSLGTASYRWAEVYASTGTINTSDERDKQHIRDLDAAERAVAARIKLLIKAFKFRDAIDRKGDQARIHFGVIAQDVRDAFIAEGLDPDRYALFCHDQWDETPEEKDADGRIVQEYRAAGDRFGIRYDELLAFIIAAL